MTVTPSCMVLTALSSWRTASVVRLRSMA